jgi:hypothetical protein
MPAPFLMARSMVSLVDRGFLGLLDGDKQARVEVGVSAAELGRDHDFADELDDHLAFFVRVDFAPGLFPLCAHGFLSMKKLRGQEN